MKLQKILLAFLVILAIAACSKTTGVPTASTPSKPENTPVGDQSSCETSDTTFKVDAEDLKGMLVAGGLNVTEFSISGSGQANSCTTAYSNALHFMQVTISAPDEKKATLGSQLNLLTNIVNNWLTLTPAWTLSRLDTYNIYMNVTINPGNHQLSKTPAEILVFSNQGFTNEAFWDAVNK